MIWTRNIYGLDGDDHITVPRIVTDSGISVTVCGGPGNDTLSGLEGDDRLYSGGGND